MLKVSKCNGKLQKIRFNTLRVDCKFLATSKTKIYKSWSLLLGFQMVKFHSVSFHCEIFQTRRPTASKASKTLYFLRNDLEDATQQHFWTPWNKVASFKISICNLFPQLLVILFFNCICSVENDCGLTRAVTKRTRSCPWVNFVAIKKHARSFCIGLQNLRTKFSVLSLK